MGTVDFIDTMLKDGLWDAFHGYHMGVTAENVAREFQISRETQDAFAVASQNKAESARKEGRFKGQIAPVTVKGRRSETLVEEDEYIRDGATLVRNAEDILEALAVPAPRAVQPEPEPETILAEPPETKRSLRDVAALHQQVLDRLGPSPLAEDQLIRDCNAPASEISSALLDLEMEGQIERQTGGFLMRKTA